MLDSPFDHDTDDYTKSYAVFKVHSSEDLKAILAKWETVPKELIGYFPVKQVIFDDMHRKFIDVSFLNHLSNEG